MRRPRVSRRLAVASLFAFAASTGTAAAAALSLSTAGLTLFTKTVVRATCTIAAPSADAYVREGVLSAGTNFGAAATLDVDAAAADRRFAFLRFELASCGLPPGAWVESATLTLTVVATPGARTYEVRRVTSEWEEAEITWVEQPATALTPTATFALPASAPAQRTVDVTADVDAAVSGSATHRGWRVQDAGTTLGSALGRLASREDADAPRRPQLVIDYAR